MNDSTYSPKKQKFLRFTSTTFGDKTMFNISTNQAHLPMETYGFSKWFYFGFLMVIFCIADLANADDGKIYNGNLCKSANNVTMSYGFKGGIKNTDPLFYATVVCPVVRDSMSSLDSAKYVSVRVDDKNFSAYKDFYCTWRSLEYDGDLTVYRSLSTYYGSGQRTLSRSLPYCTGSCVGGSQWSYLLVCNIPQRYGSSGFSNLMHYRVIEEN